MNTMDESINPTKKYLLYIEDDRIAYDVVRMFLRDYFEIDWANSAEAGFKMLIEKNYAGILMDINLARGMDGIQATQAIRQMPGFEKIPIIAITAYAMLHDKDEFLSKGCTAYISKPFSRNDLQELVTDTIK